MAITDVIEFTIVPAGTSIGASFNSAYQDVKYHNRGAIQGVWTGADAVDALVVPQASLDKVNWCDLASGSLIKKIDAATGNLMYEFTDMGYSYWRIRFDAASNTTGTIQVLTVLKRDRGYGVP
jgi:hypothetical protein